MREDSQVTTLRKIPEPESLHDVVLRMYDTSSRDAGQLFTICLLLCGKKVSDAPVGPILERVANAAAVEADSVNPFVAFKSPDVICTGVLIDYGAEFIQLVEGPERHIYGYMSALKEMHETVTDVHILYFEDDVHGCLHPGWLCIDKVPTNCVGGEPQDKSDEEIADAIVQDLKSLRELGMAAKHPDGAQRAFFADNAKINHAKLFPKSTIIDNYIDSDMFLTLNEFDESFCRLPSGCREAEISHPIEDPLKY